MFELILLYCWVGMERVPCKEIAPRVLHNTYVSCAYQGNIEVSKRNNSWQKMYWGGEKTVAICLPAGLELEQYAHLNLLEAITGISAILPSPHDLPH